LHTAAELTRLKIAIAILENELQRTGMELVLDVVGPRREVTLLTMSTGAGLFVLGGTYGFPESDRLSSGIGSRNEHGTRRCIVLDAVSSL
jgi:hypothetical protein